jgi:hypothetical protein
MIAFAILELNSNPSIGLPFQLRPWLISLTLMRKRSFSIDTTVCVCDIGVQIPCWGVEGIVAHCQPTW